MASPLAVALLGILAGVGEGLVEKKKEKKEKEKEEKKEDEKQAILRQGILDKQTAESREELAASRQFALEQRGLELETGRLEESTRSAKARETGETEDRQLKETLAEINDIYSRNLAAKQQEVDQSRFLNTILRASGTGKGKKSNRVIDTVQNMLATGQLSPRSFTDPDKAKELMQFITGLRKTFDTLEPPEEEEEEDIDLDEVDRKIQEGIELTPKEEEALSAAIGEARNEELGTKTDIPFISSIAGAPTNFGGFNPDVQDNPYSLNPPTFIGRPSAVPLGGIPGPGLPININEALLGLLAGEDQGPLITRPGYMSSLSRRRNRPEFSPVRTLR